jgi:hypothetical protein
VRCLTATQCNNLIILPGRHRCTSSSCWDLGRHRPGALIVDFFPSSSRGPPPLHPSLYSELHPSLYGVAHDASIPQAEIGSWCESLLLGPGPPSLSSHHCWGLAFQLRCVRVRRSSLAKMRMLREKNRADVAAARAPWAAGAGAAETERGSHARARGQQGGWARRGSVSGAGRSRAGGSCNGDD